MINNIIFDCGRVLAYPKTGNWYITPETQRILGVRNMFRILLHLGQLGKAFRYANRYLDENHLLHTEEEEIIQFTEFYRRFLGSMGIKWDIDYLASRLAKDNVRNDEKFAFYTDVYETLAALKPHYRIFVLSDTWPSLKRVLNNKNILPFLDGLVMSCDHGMCKDNIKLFRTAIKEFVIDPKCSVFIDDSELNLKNAEAAGLIPVLMDRSGKKSKSDYPIVYNMSDILSFIEKYH